MSTSPRTSLSKLRKAHLFTQIPESFYRYTIESILMNCISVWNGSCSGSDWKAHQCVLNTTQHITGAQQPSIADIYHGCCRWRVKAIIKDNSQPSQWPLRVLPSGKHYRSLCCCTSKLRNSFFPSAINILNYAANLIFFILLIAGRSTYTTAQFAHAHPYSCTWTSLEQFAQYYLHSAFILLDCIHYCNPCVQTHSHTHTSHHLHITYTLLLPYLIAVYTWCDVT